RTNFRAEQLAEKTLSSTGLGFRQLGHALYVHGQDTLDQLHPGLQCPCETRGILGHERLPF
ncbi:MAG: hypothetical protein AAGL92_11995, partial [Pseudomonadota bacterium]